MLTLLPSLAAHLCGPVDTNGGGGGYVASDVQFGIGTASFARGAALVASDGPTGFYSAWVRPDALAGFVDLVYVPNGNFWFKFDGSGILRAFVYDNGQDNGAEIFSNSPITFGEETHILIAWDMNYASGSRRFAVYFDDAPIAITYDYETGAAVNIDYATADFFAFVATELTVPLGVSDTGCWLGSTIVEADSTISELNRRKFIDALGNPVDPANWPASPVLKFAGAAAAFATNQGSGGAFTRTGGSLTDV